MAIPLPHQQCPIPLAPLHAPIGCELLEGQTHPQDSSLNPKNFPPGLPPPLDDWQHPRPRSPSYLDGGTFQGGSNVPHGLVRGEDVIRGVTPPETETVLGEGA